MRLPIQKYEYHFIFAKFIITKNVHLLFYTGFIDTVDKTLFYQFLLDAVTTLEQFQFSQKLSVTFNDYILIASFLICPALEI